MSYYIPDTGGAGNPEMTFISRLPRRVYELEIQSVGADKRSQQLKSNSQKQQKSRAKGSVSSKASKQSKTSVRSKTSSKSKATRSATGSIARLSELSSLNKVEESVDQLEVWMNWRKQVNHEIAGDLLSRTFHEIKSLDETQSYELVKHTGIYHYGITIDQATSLLEMDFINFGVPRAHVDKLFTSDDKSSTQEQITTSTVDTVPDIDYPLALGGEFLY